LPADDRGDRNYMVRIGGVPHSEKETNGNDGKKADHVLKTGARNYVRFLC